MHKRWMKRLPGLLATVLLLVGLTAGCGQPRTGSRAQADQGARTGSQAPSGHPVTGSRAQTGQQTAGAPSSFSLKDINQRQFSFPGAWKGKKTALVFFSTG